MRDRVGTDPSKPNGPAPREEITGPSDTERLSDEELPAPPDGGRALALVVTACHEDALVFALRLAETAPANGGWSAAEVVDAARTFAAYLDGTDARASVEPVDHTGLCDHCDKPQTGGAGGGGLPPEHWCDDHRPDEIGGPLYPEDADASEPWEPKVGDRVTVHYDDGATRSVAAGTPGTVTNVFPSIRRAEVLVERTVTNDAPDAGWHCDYAELRPLAEATDGGAL